MFSRKIHLQRFFHTLLTAKNSNLEKAYSLLMSKVDGMAAELASLKTVQK